MTDTEESSAFEDDVMDEKVKYPSSDDNVEEENVTSTSDETPQPILHKHIIKMQRLARKRKTFLIQKLVKRVKTLKNKKGNEQQLSKNQRKIDRFIQKISDLKTISLDTVINQMIELNFTPPLESEETTMNWFICELLDDKFTFMNFVNPLLGKPIEIKPSKNKKMSSEQPRKRQKKNSGDDLFVGSLSKSTYDEDGDTVLQNILREKRNRPGQRARQKKYEEVYGDKANHLKTNKSVDKKDKPKRIDRNRDKKKETPQEIIKKIKEKSRKENDTKVKKEHPSWAAKKQQASLSTKIDIFAGTKTTFDDDED